jgi:aryl-alcohol dehydrogenase-like predicted oxidoreductase
MTKIEEKPFDLCDGVTIAKPLGIGTMQWGTTWLDNKLNKGGNLPDCVIDDIVDTVLQSGVQFFDTAEGYGGGSSEVRVRDQVLPKAHVNNVVVATKFLPTLWRWTQGSFLHAVRESNARLGVDICDLYFIHTPVHPLPLEFWIRAACVAVDLKLIKAIGISNCKASQVERAHAEACKHGKRIVANQILFNLLDYNSEELRITDDTCRKLGIRIVAYSPIGQGLLTENLTEEKFKGIRLGTMMGIKWNDSNKLFALRNKISEIAMDEGKTMAQVCLNWTICHNAIPLVGTRSKAQASNSVGCLGWRLTESQVADLDRHALARSTLGKPRWRRLIFVVAISMLVLTYRLTSFL